MLEAGDTTTGGFDRYGVRVPLIVVSPYAKAAHTGHATYDHTSITRFIETRFELAALSGRDANADPLTDLFDFEKPAFSAPPTIAEPPVDAAELAYCMATYGK
jgi:phospholipase C